jgi:hypothetical protein
VASGAAADVAQGRLDEVGRAARNAAISATFTDPGAIRYEAAAAEVDRDYTVTRCWCSGAAARSVRKRLLSFVRSRGGGVGLPREGLRIRGGRRIGPGP